MADTYQLKIKTKTAERPVIADAVKSLKAPEDYTGKQLSVLGIPFGGPLEGRDSDGETFTAKTDLWLKEGMTIPVT